MTVNKKNAEKGFTLIEVMVVIIILGILAGIVGVKVIGHILVIPNYVIPKTSLPQTNCLFNAAFSLIVPREIALNGLHQLADIGCVRYVDQQVKVVGHETKHIYRMADTFSLFLDYGDGCLGHLGVLEQLKAVRSTRCREKHAVGRRVVEMF